MGQENMSSCKTPARTMADNKMAIAIVVPGLMNSPIVTRDAATLIPMYP